jgi:hypothetical protein
VTDDDSVREAIETQMRGHDARNAALLVRVRELGAPLDIPRTIDCFFWAPSGASSDLLRARLVAKGLEEIVTSPTPDDNGKWSVQGKLFIRPDLMGSRGMTSQLVELAASCGAEYDGWGTAIHEARPEGAEGAGGSPTKGCS